MTAEKKLKVSIVTVVKNGEKYLGQCLKSIFEQTYTNLEVIVYDGASTDNTIKIINENIENIDYFQTAQDKGLSDAMNKAVQITTGDYLLFLHSDDFFTSQNSISDLIQKLDTVSDNDPKIWVSGFYNYVDSKSEIIKADVPRVYSYNDMILRNIIRHQSTLVKRDIFNELSFDTGFSFAMDYMFFLELWVNYGPPIYLEKNITNFRLDGKNLSSNLLLSMTDEMRARMKFRFLKKERIFIVFDLFIFTLRFFKLIFYHYPLRFILMKFK
jgi:glycosyltransferase involved in cell wall biosynthesis